MTMLVIPMRNSWFALLRRRRDQRAHATGALLVSKREWNAKDLGIRYTLFLSSSCSASV